MMLYSRANIKKRILQSLKMELKAVSELSKSSSDIIAAINLLAQRKGKIVVTGVGKSAFVGMKMAATLTSLGNHAFFLHPVDALHGDSGMILDGDIVVAISFSGESPEILKAIKHIKKIFSIKIVAITGNGKSSLGKLADKNIVIKVVDEGSPRNLAPMASTTASMVVSDLIAVGLVNPKRFKEIHFAKFHPSGNLGLMLKKVREIMHRGREVPKIAENSSFRKAINEINGKKKGIVAVVDRYGRLLGVVTDGDVRRFFAIHDSLSNILVRDVMTKEPKIISGDNSLRDALEKMEIHKITNLFVTDRNRKVEGILHLHDIITSS